jgi:transcriptional regulator with XRE-family HTH domain
VNVSTIKRSPHATDRHVGNRVRMRRKMQGMTQEKLGKVLGLTFQQVQKYENGTNRIGASRLQHIASIQQVPMSFFFEDAPGQSSILEERRSSNPRAAISKRRLAGLTPPPVCSPLSPTWMTRMASWPSPRSPEWG